MIKEKEMTDKVTLKFPTLSTNIKKSLGITTLVGMGAIFLGEPNLGEVVGILCITTAVGLAFGYMCDSE